MVISEYLGGLLCHYLKKFEELKQKRKFEMMPVEYQIADMLHAKLCRRNHSDGCGWEYESWDNYVYNEPVDFGRNAYVNMAKSMLAVADKDTIIKIINLM